MLYQASHSGGPQLLRPASWSPGLRIGIGIKLLGLFDFIHVRHLNFSFLKRKKVILDKVIKRLGISTNGGFPSYFPQSGRFKIEGTFTFSLVEIVSASDLATLKCYLQSIDFRQPAVNVTKCCSYSN